MFPLPRLINMFLKSKGLAPNQLNPNSWIILLSLYVVSLELGIELRVPKLKNMYIIKKNGVNEGRIYVLAR